MTRLLRRPPTVSDLERMYYELAARGAPAVGRKRSWPYRKLSDAALFCLACEMIRYDARLLTILVQYLLRSWRTNNPVELRAQMRSMSYPQVACVVVEFARAATTDAELRHFCDYLCAGWGKVEPIERLFLDTEPVASRSAARKLGRNLREYARWGFIGTERPTLNQATRELGGRYDVETRRRILREVLTEKPGLRLAHLMDTIDGGTSRQQLLADLRAIGGRPNGHGRGATWTLLPQRG